MSATDPGHIDNLSREQELALRQFYLKVFSILENFDESQLATPSSGSAPAASSASKKSRKPATDADPKTNSGRIVPDLSLLTPTSAPQRLLTEFALSIGYDHPDVFSLRFLRARKFDVEKAAMMFVGYLKWRIEFGVNELLYESEEALDRADMESGKSYFWGRDNDGRPLCVVHVKYHDKNNRDIHHLQNLVVWTMETGRLLLGHPIEMATIVFDMNGFSINKSMDYQAVQFLVGCLESYYPESLGALYIVGAPFVFNVASKIQFKKLSDLHTLIPREQIPKALMTDKDYNAALAVGHHPYEYSYRCVTKDEMARLAGVRADEAGKRKAEEEVRRTCERVVEVTKEWARGEGVEGMEGRRKEVVTDMNRAYEKFSPYIRSATHYHRIGLANDPGLDAVLKA
ncbi:hypothetical protein HK102_001156 [Quaeritorhiza haematococci]|nr:hypothetical protein HK102_001156 [Quaeritorhiza haematococci]